MIKPCKGFTLIELMITIAVMGVLAAVAVPKFGEMIEKSNLGATQGNLGAIRSAVTIYYSDRAVLPESLDVNNEKFYAVMQIIPPVKATHPRNTPPAGRNVTTGGESPSGPGFGWYYNTNTGKVWINSTAEDIKGNCYTIY